MPAPPVVHRLGHGRGHRAAAGLELAHNTCTVCGGSTRTYHASSNLQQREPTETGVIAAGEEPRQPGGQLGNWSVELSSTIEPATRAGANAGGDQAGTPARANRTDGRTGKWASRHQPRVWRAGSRAIRHSGIRVDSRVHVVVRAASHAEACHGARRGARREEARPGDICLRGEGDKQGKAGSGKAAREGGGEAR